jgi:hypothetical protein
LLGNGDGTFQAPISYSLAAQRPAALAAADFNGDGKLDLAYCGNGSGAVYIALGNGDGTFGPSAGYGIPVSCYGMTVDDFNGDGKPDVAANSLLADTVSILLGTGTGTLENAANYVTGGTYNVLAGVFNNGEPADVVTGSIVVMVNTTKPSGNEGGK